jgi:AcrR family transcriptional regulator
MTNHANTVNMPRASYHHGDLRAALIAEGLRLLTVRDADAFSLREVARGVGVSATSVYRHFPDKEALMTALAVEGLKQLGAAQAKASAAADNAAAGFAATGRAYVRFAIDHPALFRLIFASPALGPGWVPGQVGESLAGSLLMGNAARMAGQAGGEAGVRAIQAWALVHGLAMLMLDGKIPADQDLVARVVS